MYQLKKRQNHGNSSGEVNYSTPWVPATVLGKYCLLARYADIVDRNDRIIIIEITVEMKKILIANIYAPQTCREKDWFLWTDAKRYWGLRMSVLMGVFTAVMNNDYDIMNGERQNNREVEALKQFRPWAANT